MDEQEEQEQVMAKAAGMTDAELQGESAPAPRVRVGGPSLIEDEAMVFEVRSLPGNRYGFRMAENSSASTWLTGVLEALSVAVEGAPEAPRELWLRSLGPGDTPGSLRVAPFFGEPPRRGDLFLEGLKCVHAGSPGDGYRYATFETTSGSFVGEPPRTRVVDIAPLEIVFDGPPGPEAGRFVEVEREGRSVSVGEWIRRPDNFWALRIPQATMSGGNNVAALLAALAERKIVATFAPGATGNVEVRFEDREGGERLTVQAEPAGHPPRSEAGQRLPPPEEMTEEKLKATLVKILTDEHRAQMSPALEGRLVISLRDRLLSRLEAVVRPASSSREQAVAKATWFVDKVMPVLERRGRMTDLDYVILVDDVTMSARKG